MWQYEKKSSYPCCTYSSGNTLKCGTRNNRAYEKKSVKNQSTVVK